ncbi:hypothetical protein FHG87_002942 [Trinorchestia longiramus]|nr:hypothetical protein FHG87_002942 [Trinorchestia longiramus]
MIIEALLFGTQQAVNIKKMLTVGVLLALTARWCLAAPLASEYYVRGARKIDGDPTAFMLDYNDYTKSGLDKISIGTDIPQSTSTYLGHGGSTSYKPTWNWRIFGASSGKPALAEKVSLDKTNKAISTADLPSFLPSIPSLPAISLPSFLTPTRTAVASVPTPTFTSSFFPNFNFFQPALNNLGSSSLFPTNIPKPSWPGGSSFPIIRFPGNSIERSGTTVNGVPAPQTQLLVFRYPDVVGFVRNGLSAIANGFNSITTFFSDVGGGLGSIMSGDGIVVGRTEPEVTTDHQDWDV